jgi:hypothetical protein
LSNPTQDVYHQPRLETITPGYVSGTLGDEWIPWIESGGGIALRPFQRHIINRVLEVDSEGRLVWDEVVISTPRQSGKSWLVRALAIARCNFAEHFGEPQECAYLANNLVSAKRIMRRSWRWAEQNGLLIRQAMGDERMIWPDGQTMWFLSSLRGVYGASASLALVDECWDVTEDEVLEGVQPIITEREQSQMILLSTANELATGLMINARRKAIAGTPRTLILEWSADPASDLQDPAVWQAASPHWSERRGRMIAAADSKQRRYQFLNCWPGPGAEAAHWLAGWDGLQPSEGPWDGCVGGLEVSTDRTAYGAAAAVLRGDQSVDVATFTAGSLAEAMAWLDGYAPWLVMAGVSLKAEVEMGGMWTTRPAGVRESGLSTPWLSAAVRSRRLRHDHREGVSVEASRSVVTDTEAGPLISARKSRGPIPTIKATAWAAYVAAQEPIAMPAIY